jgi:hypothetical protein
MAVSHSSCYGLLSAAPFGGWYCDREVTLSYQGGMQPVWCHFGAGGMVTLTRAVPSVPLAHKEGFEFSALPL